MLGYPLVLGVDGFVGSVYLWSVWIHGFWVLYLWNVLGYPLVFGFCTCGSLLLFHTTERPHKYFKLLKNNNAIIKLILFFVK